MLVGVVLTGAGVLTGIVVPTVVAGAGGNPAVLHTTSVSGPNVSVGDVLTGVGSLSSLAGAACSSLATDATVVSNPDDPGTAQLNLTNAAFSECTGPGSTALTITEESYPITETISDTAGDPVTTGPQTVAVDSSTYGFDCR